MRHYLAVVISGVVTSDGRPIVYSSGDDDLHDSIFREGTYALRRGALQSISAFSSSIEDGASSATSGVTTLSLHADDLSVIGYRPIDIFSRVGAESLTTSQLWATQTVSAGDTTIQLLSGTAQTVSPALLHVGVETVLASSTSIPSSGSITVSRGQCGTVAMPHRANLSGFLARTIPVSIVPVEWIGRRVHVFVDCQLWRTMILTDDPHVDAYSVTLSLIDAVNVLSIQKKSCQVPAYSTTLSAQTISLTHDLVYSRPGFSVPVTRANAMVTTPATFASTNGGFTGGTQAAREAVLYAFKWWQKPLGADYLYGKTGLPPLTLRLTADPVAGTNYETTYELEMNGGTGTATTTITSTCYLGPARPSQNLDDFLAEASSRTFYLRRATFGPVTYWTDATFAIGGAIGWSSPTIWNTSNNGSPWGLSMTSSGRILLKSRYAPQTGWPDAGLLPNDRPFWVGLVSRRNLSAADDPAELSTAESLVDGLYSTWASSPRSNSQVYGPVELYRGDGPDFYHSFYAIRSRNEGEIHNVVVTPLGVVVQLDADQWMRTRTSGSIDVDYCENGLWWEPGIYQIKTTATIPMSGNSGEVEIRWQEPSEEWLRAVATVTYVSTSAGVSTYNINQDVTMLSGAPCVGFGTWHGFAACQITPPTFVRSAHLGSILARIIASSDSTSGRISDSLGDGFGIPISSQGMLSFSATIAAGCGSLFRFAADEDLSYNDFLELACRISGSSVVGRLTDPADLVAGYGPVSVPMGRPMASESRARWTDADIIGIPTTADGFAGPVYTSYAITAGRRHWQVDDWLAGDLLGQGEELELDLTPIVLHPELLTNDGIEQLVDRLRDRYGVIRRRWSLRVPIEKTIDLGVGDVVSVTSEYLIDPAGGLGVTDRLARILSITHDFTAAVSDVELIAYASYGAGWAASYDVQISSVSSTTYTLQILGTSSPSTVPDYRREQDLALYPPTVSSSSYYYLVQTEGTAAGGIAQGYLTAWNASTHTATWIRTSITASPTPSGNGYRCVLVPATIPASQVDLFQLGRDRLL